MILYRKGHNRRLFAGCTDFHGPFGEDIGIDGKYCCTDKIEKKRNDNNADDIDEYADSLHRFL